MKLTVIIASTRPGRVGLSIGQWFYEFAKKQKTFDVELVDLAELNLPLIDEPNHPRLHTYTKEHTKQWSKIIAASDAFVFVIPEYNFSAPPSLINAIDYLLIEWQYKPAGLVSYGGMSGGLRSSQMLKQTITGVDMMPISEQVSISFVKTHMTEDNQFIPSERYDKQATTMLEKLSLWSKHLKNLREEIQKS